MHNLDKGKIITLNIFVIALFIYFCFFTNNLSKPAAVLIFILTILFFLYQDILKRMFLNCSKLLFRKCNTKDAKELLSKIEKIDVLGLYRKNCFILKCAIILDDFSEEAFTNFMNDNKKSKLLRNPYCNLTFSITLLQYFFLTNSREQYHSLYKKTVTSKASQAALTDYYKKLLSILNSAFDKPDQKQLKHLHHLKQEAHTKRDEIYINLYSGYICNSLLNQKAEAEHFIKKAQQISDTFVLSSDFQTTFCAAGSYER